MLFLNSRLLVALIALSLALVPSLVCVADEVESSNESITQYDAEEKIIRDQAMEYEKDFALGDAKAIAAMWIPNGTFIDVDGNEIYGRPEIEKLYASYFKEHGKQNIDVQINSIRFPATNMAIEEGTSHLIGVPSATTGSKYILVHVKRNGKWQICSATEIRLKPLTSSVSLKDLSWLIGKWQPDSAKDRFKLNTKWISNNHFISCTFLPKDSTNLDITDIQIIGWDSIRQQLTSWNFSSNGGYGRALWTKDGDNWLLLAHSVQPNGTEGTATHVLHRIDDDTFTWKTVKRSFNGRPLPDTVEVKLSRLVE